MLPAELRFRHRWRAYQGRILADFDTHAADRHFHVVAAPGSGKTVLGLEVVRRVGRPALVCAPSLALRGQWIERLCEQFLDGARPSWISDDAASPGLLTFETYQALHAHARRHGIRALARTLKAAEVGTLVFDEAHHLKQEWWRTLEALQRAMPGAFIVALTATPPYDVPQLEWNRYATLAGPVDAEISAAELVRAGDLCPHQDYVYLQRPTPRETAERAAFAGRVRAFLGELGIDQSLVLAVQSHPAVADPPAHLELLLDEPEYALSLAIFLSHAAGVVPRPFLEALGVEREILPPFDAWWAERLLQGVVFGDAASFVTHAAQVEALRRGLQEIGALERRTVHLLSSPTLERALRTSPAKLRAVADIVEAEGRSLGEELRLLVLTERIRDHGLRGSAAAGRVGVVPLFDRLRRLRLPHVRLCAATGKLGIVPRELLPEVETALGVAAGERATELPEAPEYSRIALAGEDGALFVRVVTRAFEEGRLTVIVGTTALLGEGWDAPALNSLVLATAVGSYVASNQSRGRALRRDPQRPSKTASIWHPVCVEPRDAEASELELLRRRFGTFLGPGLERPVVESGLARLGVPERGLETEEIDALNASMFRHAEDRAAMAALWRQALLPAPGGEGRAVRETRLAHANVRRVAIPFLGPRGRLGGWYSRWRLRRRATGIARALVEALHETGVTKTAPRELELQVAVTSDKVLVRALGLGTRDEMVLHEALQEVFCPLGRPRYLLAGRGRAYPVPRVLGENRTRSEVLRRRWRRRVGRVRLVPTRTPEGKRLLLATVERYLASHCRERADTATRWLAVTSSAAPGP